MDCSNVVETLSFYIDGEIDEHTLEVVESHIERCPACRREYAALSALTQAASSVEAVEPPAGLRERIAQAVMNSKRDARRCARTGELLSAWIDGELGDKQRALVSAHLAECEDCAAGAESLRVLTSIAGSIEQVEPPASLRARIAAAVASEPFQRGILARLREALAVGSLRWAGAAAAAGLTAVIAISTFSGPEETAHKAKDPDVSAPAQTAAVVSKPKHQPAVVAAPDRDPRQAASRSTSAPVRLGGKPRKTVSGIDTASSAAKAAVPLPTFKHSVPRPVETEPETQVEAVVADSKPEPEEITVVSEPRSEPEPEPAKPDRPVVTRVATTAFTEDAKEWLKEIKTEAVMRKGESRGGIQLVTSRF
jgi:anti-sigma factor (TIGR02949 family)